MSSTDIMGQGLATRIAGQSEIEQLLRSHEGTLPRSTVARVLGVSPLSVDERPWYLGALGETITGRMLAQLPEGWKVLHDVSIGTGPSDVDHIVIGPGGVFTINTKHHGGKAVFVGNRELSVGGTVMPYLRASAYEAERATITLSRILPPEVDVTPVLAFVRPKSITLSPSATIVKVIDAHNLVRWLRQLPAVLTQDQVALITIVAADPATWHSTRRVTTEPIGTRPDCGRQDAAVQDAAGMSDSAPRSLTQRFTDIDREVRLARRTRFAWLSVGAAAMVSAASVTILAVVDLVARILG